MEKSMQQNDPHRLPRQCLGITAALQAMPPPCWPVSGLAETTFTPSQQLVQGRQWLCV